MGISKNPDLRAAAFLLTPFRHNTLLLAKNVSLPIKHMLRHHFLLVPRFV